VIQRNKIPDYKFDGIGDCLDMWQVWERKNLLPYPGTYLQQPAPVWDMLRMFDGIYAEFQKAESDMAALMSKSKARR